MGRPTEGQGCSGEHSAELRWTLVRERQRAAMGARERRTNAQMAPPLAPGPHGSCSLKVVLRKQPLPGHPHPQTSDYLGRLCVPRGDIPLSTHYGGMPGIRSMGR